MPFKFLGRMVDRLYGVDSSFHSLGSLRPFFDATRQAGGLRPYPEGVLRDLLSEKKPLHQRIARAAMFEKPMRGVWHRLLLDHSNVVLDAYLAALKHQCQLDMLSHDDARMKQASALLPSLRKDSPKVLELARSIAQYRKAFQAF